MGELPFEQPNLSHHFCDQPDPVRLYAAMEIISAIAATEGGEGGHIT